MAQPLPISSFERLSATGNWGDFKREALLIAKAQPELWSAIADLAEARFDGGHEAVLNIRRQIANGERIVEAEAAPKKRSSFFSSSPQPRVLPPGLVPLLAELDVGKISKVQGFIRKLATHIPFDTDIEDDVLSKIEGQFGIALADWSYDFLADARDAWANDYQAAQAIEANTKLPAVVPLGFAPLATDEALDLDPVAPFDNAQKIVTLRAWAFSEQFGMENFIGKKVAVFSDARLDGVPQRNLSTIAERLLMITGEDEMHINRKNMKYWNGNLATKPVIFSNELLRFQEESGALAGRFLTFRMQQSFYGREDEELTDKLLAERPGILNLAIEALDELRARGKLIQSETGIEMSERLGDLTSDVKRFVDECCEIGVEFEVLVSKIYERWQSWCWQHNTRHGWNDNHFSEKLRSLVPTITSSRPRKVAGEDNPKRHTVLFGIGVKKLKILKESGQK